MSRALTWFDTKTTGRSGSLASNSAVNLFHRGFKACDDFLGAEAAMDQVKCPVLFILGRSDSMTPPKLAQPLIAKAPTAKVVLVEASHQMMVEAPEAVLAALVDFLPP